MNQYVDNILTEFHRTPHAIKRSGMHWYHNVHDLACEMGNGDESVHVAAGVIAALSPNMPWERNLALARRAMEDGGIVRGTFGQSIVKANRIIAGEMPSSVLSNGKTGFKTLNFYRNISNPENATPVTIDRHAYDIAVGTRHGSDHRPTLGSSLKAYEVFAQAYRDAAESEGILPHQMQAITWESYRSRLPSRRGAVRRVA